MSEKKKKFNLIQSSLVSLKIKQRQSKATFGYVFDPTKNLPKNSNNATLYYNKICYSMLVIITMVMTTSFALLSLLTINK